MASSVASASSASPYESTQRSPTGDESDSWVYVDPGASPASLGFFPSPASGSLAGFAVVDGGPSSGGPFRPVPSAFSPVCSSFASSPIVPPVDVLGTAAMASASPAPSGPLDETGQSLLTTQDWLLMQMQIDMNNEVPFMNSMVSTGPALSGLESVDTSGVPFDIPKQYGTAHDADWSPRIFGPDPRAQLDEFVLSSSVQAQLYQQSPLSQHELAASLSPMASASMSPPAVPAQYPTSLPGRYASDPVRKVKGAKVGKRKAEPAKAATSAGKFVIVTPHLINAQAGKPNPFECFEAASRGTQRGRKGPLPDETKENARLVRRRGACFCCHNRKVRCDKERPCSNCKKLMVQVPQVVCWQFQDFLVVLFPDFIREHFRKDEMARYMRENVHAFTVNGAEWPCDVQLFSGGRFGATLTVRAKFFTPRTIDAVQHWHMRTAGERVDLQAQRAAPIALEPDGGADGSLSSKKDHLKKKAREYINAILREPAYAEQLTASFRHTDLPRKILSIVQRYNEQSYSPVVKKALSIYAMHYVMTRHLCLTRETVVALQHTNLVPQGHPWVTPRVLNRQIKAVLDDLQTRETQLLFEAFAKALKQKSKREWAPCVAAFLVFCLFMESIETAADSFVVTQNEISLQEEQRQQHQGTVKRRPPQHPQRYTRAFALGINREVEALPFKQFAHVFHQIYQTHSKDAATKSFNPLMDDEALPGGADADAANELDAPAVEMVCGLRQLVRDRASWAELDFLTMDPAVSDLEAHPRARDAAVSYEGRLVAKFLLSFTREGYVFEQ